MRKLFALLAAVAIVLGTGTAALAQAVPVPANTPVVEPVRNAYTYAPLGMGLTVIGVGIGLGMIGFGAMGGIARQPEQADNIRTAMLIIGGLVEGAGIIALVLCLVAKQ